MKKPRTPVTIARHQPHITMTIEWVDVDDLRFSQYNPRNIGEDAVKKLSESIGMHGFVNPCIVNRAPRRKNILIAGHARVLAAKVLGMKKVPVVFVDEPNLEREKTLNVKLNIDAGEWDFSKLRELFDADFLMDVGFNDADVQRIFDDALETEDDHFDVEKELADIKEPKAKPGDLYCLGSHRLICGDATDHAVVERLVGKERMDMLYIDTPFNLQISYDHGIGGRQNYGGKTNDAKSPEEYERFLRAVYANAVAVGKEDLHIFGWNDETNVGLMQRIFSDLGLRNRRTCLWIKGAANVVPGTAFGKCYEACLYSTRGRPYLSEAYQNYCEILNREIGPGNRALDDILDVLNLWLERRIPGKEYQHATQKPVPLAERPLRRCTKPQANVIDTTGGSGTTLISCEQMKRRCFMAEIEPIFIDLIIRRWESLTGLKASLLKP
ncbi:MAG: DNA modification methylase [Candidatus Peribacteraceae bacterium]|nr:DNA modification methylase [Candidatus Peribacteraceae bacterium]